jgi:O-antigen ligase
MSAPPPPLPTTGRWLERLSAWHAAMFVIAATWLFGGNIYWARLPLSLWGTLAALFTIAGLMRRWREAEDRWRPVRWLLPWAGLSVLILLGTMNPNYAEVQFFDGPVFRAKSPAVVWLPSSARPDLAVSEWWLLSGLYLTGFNLALNVRRRRVLRAVLLVLVLNGSLLAVFGTVQKLTGATGLFFGLQRSPNPTFFASFIYHNHWGSFALLMMTAGLGLIAHQSHSTKDRSLWHSPAALLVAMVILLAASIPLSSSRSSTVLLLVVLLVAVVHAARGIGAAVTLDPAARRWRLLLLIAGGAATLSVMGWLSAPVLHARWEKTREQVSSWREVGGLGGREILYRDTWRMAMDRPWTGWGLESYETVFVRYNTATSPRDRLRVHFDQAHSDWLQALAETGFIGTALLLLSGALPLWTWRRALARPSDPIANGALLGCGVVVLYAWVEFPLANPAVVLSFWVLFFAGLRHAVLSAR